MLELPVKISLAEGASPPYYASEHAAGADLYAHLDSPAKLNSHERRLIPTGVFMELPPGFEAQIRPRSGLAYQHGITVLNAPGTIDADYRGEVMVLVINTGDRPYVIKPGERIAQMVIQSALRARFAVEPSISETPRGSGGFGSTGT